MATTARFKVDPRLATLLGEGYRSSEEALKELVDNAWDADADGVRISLPREMTNAPIVIEDDGSGMTEKELREEYLFIANDRRSRKGDATPDKRRRVKGRKGIGKFAGLISGDTMVVETRARGKQTRLQVRKEDLLGVRQDIEQIDLPIEVTNCGPLERGTTVTISSLNQRLEFPREEIFRQLLIRDYGREQSFEIEVNGQKLSIEDIPGETFTETVELPNVGPVTIRFTISTDKKALKQPGIAVRVGGKLVGRPTPMGLESDDEIPGKLLKRVYGEVEADGLADEVTADWGAILENSLAFKEVTAWAAAQLKEKVENTFKTEVNLQKARLKKQVHERLAKLPDNRRSAAEHAINKVLKRFYGESEERISTVVGLMLDAFERDEYWVVLQKIDDSTRADVARLADVLGEFGLVDLAIIGNQARGRLGFLDELDGLAGSDDTVESQIHRVVEDNLWVLGADYALLGSNQTLRRVVDQWADKKFAGKRARKRPDLLLAQALRSRYVVIEFKRPSHTLNREDEAQAGQYRDDLVPYVQGHRIDIVLLGGKRSAGISSQYDTTGLTVLTYNDMINEARAQLDWLLNQLGTPYTR